MKKTLLAWGIGTVMGMASLSGIAVAQTAAGKTGAGAASGNTAASATQGQAADSCNSRKGADQKKCLDEVRAQQQAQRGTAGKSGTTRQPKSADAMPAVQTQSSEVSATGVAPSTQGPKPAPGTPATPRK